MNTAFEIARGKPFRSNAHSFGFCSLYNKTAPFCSQFHPSLTKLHFLDWIIVQFMGIQFHPQLSMPHFTWNLTFLNFRPKKKRNTFHFIFGRKYWYAHSGTLKFSAEKAVSTGRFFFFTLSAGVTSSTSIVGTKRKSGWKAVSTARLVFFGRKWRNSPKIGRWKQDLKSVKAWI